MSTVKENLETVRKWIEEAKADGWSIEPLYDHEPMAQAARMKKNGFIVQVLTRPADTRPAWVYKKVDEAEITLWNKKGLGVLPPVPYSMDEILKNESLCDKCGKSSEVSRVGFANKSCAPCLPAMQKEHEYPGWCN